MAAQIRPYVEGGSVAFPNRDLTKEPPFGMLTAVSFAGRGVRGAAYWTCRCSCGAVRSVVHGKLVGGYTISCGCAKAERARKLFTTHGKYKLPEYGVWAGVVQRCCNPSIHNFHRYGGAGVTICDRWRNSFEDFYADMGPRPSPAHSIERVKNELGYAPDNCEWATAGDQANNRSTSNKREYNGEIKTVAQWARYAGMPYSLLWRRLARGWSIEKAITTAHAHSR